MWRPGGAATAESGVGTPSGFARFRPERNTLLFKNRVSYIKVRGCLSVAKGLANHRTNMVLLYSKGSNRSAKVLYLFYRSSLINATIKISARSWTNNYSKSTDGLTDRQTDLMSRTVAFLLSQLVIIQLEIKYPSWCINMLYTLYTLVLGGCWGGGGGSVFLGPWVFLCLWS